MTATCCVPAKPARCSATGSQRPRRWGRFSRGFTFGHVRQLDRVPRGESATGTWAAGAGPGLERLIVDVDSFVGQVWYGYGKQGRRLWVHPQALATTRSSRPAPGAARKASYPARKVGEHGQGALRFVEELIPRVERAGAERTELLRADSGFWNKNSDEPAASGGMDVLDRDPPAGARQGCDRRDPEPRLAAPRRVAPLVAKRRSLETKLGPQRWSCADLYALAAPAGLAAVARLGATTRSSSETALRTRLGLAEAEHCGHGHRQSLAIRDLKDQALAHSPASSRPTLPGP